MFKNYLKIAFRNLYKQKVHSFINIFGLAVDIACCILIMLFVANEWSFDRFHASSDRLYRAWVHEDYGDDEIYFNTVTPLVLAATLEDHIPEVEATTRFFNFTNLRLYRPRAVQRRNVRRTIRSRSPIRNFQGGDTREFFNVIGHYG